MKYTFKSNLFVTGSGKPMLFFLNDCSIKEQLARYIQHGGGSIADSSLGPYTIKLVDNNYSPSDGEVSFSSDFIITSCKRNTLSNLRRHRIGNNNFNEDFDFNTILQQDTTWSRAKDKHMSVRSTSVQSSPKEVMSTDPTSNNDMSRIPVVVCQKLSDNPINNVTGKPSSCFRMRLQQEQHCPSPESSSESLSETSLQQKKHRRSSFRQPFSDYERMQIVDYIMKTNSFDLVGGTKLWKSMERRKICIGRTWQSLKEHFRKKILSNIDRYSLPTHAIQAFKSSKKLHNFGSSVEEKSDREDTHSEATKEVPSSLIRKSPDKKKERNSTAAYVSTSELESSPEVEIPQVKRLRKKLYTVHTTPESSRPPTPLSVQRAGPSQLDLKLKNYSLHLQYKKRIVKQKAAALKASESNSNLVSATDTSNHYMADSESEGQVALLDAPDLTPTHAPHDPEISRTSHHEPNCGNDDGAETHPSQASNLKKVNKNLNLCGDVDEGSNSSPTHQRGITNDSSPRNEASRKSPPLSKEGPASQDLFSTPQECEEEIAPETDSEINTSVLKQVTSSSQVMEPDDHFNLWTQCTPEEIIMEDLCDDSGDNSNRVEGNKDPLQGEISEADEEDAQHKENDQSVEKNVVQERISASDSVRSENENGVTHAKSGAASPASKKGSPVIEQATARDECFQDPSDWSDDGLYWRGNVYCVKKSSKAVSHNSENVVSSMKTIHCGQSTPKKDDPKNPVSPTSDVDSEAETWKCSVSEARRHKEQQAQSLLDCQKASKQNMCCREESDNRSQFVQQWLLSTPQQNVDSRIPDVNHEMVRELEKPCAEDRNLRERAPLDDEVSYSQFHFGGDLTVLSDSHTHDPRDAQEEQSNVFKKPNLPMLTVDRAVQTDPVQFCDHKVCPSVSNSSVLLSQTEERHALSEGSPLPSLCTSPTKVPTSAVSHSSAAVKSPQRPGTRNVSFSTVRTRSSSRGVSSPRSPKFLPL